MVIIECNEECSSCVKFCVLFDFYVEFSKTANLRKIYDNICHIRENLQKHFMLRKSLPKLNIPVTKYNVWAILVNKQRPPHN